MKRAFTLIELLVVIAIIAVLAAILFPVFAQAKRAAKGTTSLSNSKQLALASLMYSNDHDDFMVLSGSYNTGDDPIKFPDGTTVSPWSWLVAPYVKAGALYDDPAGTATPNLYQLSELVSKMVVPQYGYNHGYLSPTFLDTDGLYRQKGIAATAIGNSGGTVMLASKFSYMDSTGLKMGNFFSLGDFGAPLWSTVEAPTCFEPDRLCFIPGWGRNDGFVNNDPDGEGVLNPEAGAYSGGVSIRAGVAIVAFTDGHAQKLSLGKLAVGTNWTSDLNASDVQLTEKDKYLWDLE